MLHEKKQKLKDTIKSIKTQRYHKFQKKYALKALKTIELEKGKLAKSIMEQCDKYAVEYLGDIKYAPWLYVYAAMQGEFKHGWIPNNYYSEVVIKEIEGIFSLQSEMKPITNRVLKTKNLPDLLYVHGGMFLEPDNYNVVSNDEAFDLLFSKYDEVIFKSNNSMEGSGIKFYKKANWIAGEIEKDSGVFQEIIKQHDVFNNIFPYPGATIRLTTALDLNGNAKVRAAYLRLGRINDDSKHVQSSSAIRIPIKLSTGELATEGYTADWRSTKKHPDTGVTFEGSIIPSFKEACTEVEGLHNNYPFVQSVGWDVSINENEQVQIMEWNSAHNSITFSEAIQGPCFPEVLERTTKLMQTKTYAGIKIPLNV